MRRSIAKKGQDICFFCALRLEAASSPSLRQSPRQLRAYRSSTPSWRPAGAAAAQREEEDDNSHVLQRAHSAAPTPNQPPELFWKCRCGHFNLPRRHECTICSLTMPPGAQPVQKPPPSSTQPPPWSHPEQPSQPPIISSVASTTSTPAPSLTSRLNLSSTSREAPAAFRATGSEPQRYQQRFEKSQEFSNLQRPAAEPPAPRRNFASFMDNIARNPQPQPKPQRDQDSRGPAAASLHPRFPPRGEDSKTAFELSRDRRHLGSAQQVPAQTSDRGTRLGNFIKGLADDPNPIPPTSRPGDHPASRNSEPLNQLGTRPKPSSPLPPRSRPNRLVFQGEDALNQLVAGSGQQSNSTSQQSQSTTRGLQSTPQRSQSTPQPFTNRRLDASGPSMRSYEPLETNRRSQRSPAPDNTFPGPLPRRRREPNTEFNDKTGWHLRPKGPDKPDNAPLSESTPIDQTVDGFDEEVQLGRRRKSSKIVDRRRERFELDDTIASSIESGMSHRRSKSTFGGRKDPSAAAFELELADVERRLAEGNDKDSDRRKKQRQARKQAQRAKPRLEIPEFISVENLAKALKMRLEKFIDQLEDEGFEGARYDHVLDSQTSAMFAELHGFEPVLLEADIQRDIVAQPPPEDPSTCPPRPPIVTIMGHVDHGKTTILDWLRKSSVVESEHGGITQHIGAFSVTMPGSQRSITFLDTPGHAAFLDMRRRGANVTDIVVLVVAADDSVKPQTLEAIKHAKDAGVHMIVAINKIDKADADVERVKQDLAREDVTVEDYGGEYQAIPLSGKTGQGMANLEEAIITLADVSDFRAETEGPVEGAIIESKVTAAGRVATILVRRGTLKIGDFIVAGNTWARVRTLRNDAGQSVEEAPPGTPVQVDGWRGEDPSAGLEVLQADDEQHAKDVVDLRTEKTENMKIATEMASLNATKSEAAEARTKVKEWEKEQGWGLGKHRAGRPWDNEGWVEPTESSGPKRVHFVVKADVAGSTEAIVAAVSAIGNSEVVANIIHSGTGHLGESDVRLLAATGEVSYAINFNQPIEGTIHRLAEAANVQIMDHNIIYKVTDQVKEKLADELPPLVTHKVHGEAEVGQIFEITTKKSKVKVAGCKVTNGTISRSQKVKVVRSNEVIYTGTLDSLKNVKKDVSEMRRGSECGMAFDGWDEFEEGDKIQCFEELKEKRKLY